MSPREKKERASAHVTCFERMTTCAALNLGFFN